MCTSFLRRGSVRSTSRSLAWHGLRGPADERARLQQLTASQQATMFLVLLRLQAARCSTSTVCTPPETASMDRWMKELPRCVRRSPEPRHHWLKEGPKMIVYETDDTTALPIYPAASIRYFSKHWTLNSSAINQGVAINHGFRQARRGRRA